VGSIKNVLALDELNGNELEDGRSNRMPGDTVMTPYAHLPIPLDWLPLFSEATRTEILAAVATNGQALGLPAQAVTSAPSAERHTASVSKPGLAAQGGDAEDPWSYPLNVRQAVKLNSGIDDGTKRVLRRIAENYQPDKGLGLIDWPEAKALSGANDYAHFARGHRSGLTRRLRKITGDPDAQLLIENEDWEWPEGATDWTIGTFFIDGPAVLALRIYFGLPQ
jgi:hypothetical protein